MAAAHSPPTLPAPPAFSLIAAATNASRMSHGLAILPDNAATLSLYPIQVLGINCAGPMAPPQPLKLPSRFFIGQETGVTSGSNPKSDVICRKGWISRGGFITTL